VPTPEPGRRPAGTGTGRRPRSRPKQLRCESCLDVLSLRHAWDVRSCSCGALLLSGRPNEPAVHWLSRPGGGWTETGDELDISCPVASVAEAAPQDTEEPRRRFGFSPTAW
jgi:hypothetical protein